MLPGWRAAAGREAADTRCRAPSSVTTASSLMSAVRSNSAPAAADSTARSLCGSGASAPCPAASYERPCLLTQLHEHLWKLCKGARLHRWAHPGIKGLLTVRCNAGPGS